MLSTNTNPSIPCHECQAGQMQRQLLTYFTWLGDELITVPNFPAWICDFCGRREYDSQAVNRLTLLLNPNAGRPSITSQNMHPPAVKGHRITPE